MIKRLLYFFSGYSFLAKLFPEDLLFMRIFKWKLDFKLALYKILIPLALILVLLTLLDSCTDDAPTYPGQDDRTSTLPSETAGRSVLVYMLADNSLGRDGYDRENLADMIEVAQKGELHGNRLIIYHDDRNASAPMLKEVTTKGLQIIKEYDNSLKSTDPRRLTDVISDFKAQAPAEHYGLIFWSHATGWIRVTAPAATASPMWVGEDRGNYMEINELASALSGKGFDWIYFDCCHMASIEALYELRDAADYFVGSAAEIPAKGMDYTTALPLLMADDSDLVGAARATFDYYNALTGSSRTATMSVIRSDGLAPLADATRRLYTSHPTLPAGYSPQPFERTKYNGEPCYLYDFKDYIEAMCASDPAYIQWLDALNNCIVYQAFTPWIFNSIAVKAHCGLTTYILRNAADAATRGYSATSWYTDVASTLFE